MCPLLPPISIVVVAFFFLIFSWFFLSVLSRCENRNASEITIILLFFLILVSHQKERVNGKNAIIVSFYSGFFVKKATEKKKENRIDFDCDSWFFFFCLLPLFAHDIHSIVLIAVWISTIKRQIFVVIRFFGMSIHFFIEKRSFWIHFFFFSSLFFILCLVCFPFIDCSFFGWKN